MTSIRWLKRILAACLILYALVGLILRLGFKTEVFPIFTWDLFSSVPASTASDFDLKVAVLAGQPLDPPRYFSRAPDLFSQATSLQASDMINRLGLACVNQDARLQQAVAQYLASEYLPAQSRYAVVQRTYDVLDFYQNATVLTETVVCEIGE